MRMVDKISFKYFLDNMIKEDSKTYWCIHNGYRYGERMRFDRIEFSFVEPKTEMEVICSNEDANGNLRTNSIKEAYLQFVEAACSHSQEIRRKFTNSDNPQKYRLYTKEDYIKMTAENVSSTRVNDSRTIKIDGVDYYVAQNLKIGEFIKVCCEVVPVEMREEYFIRLYEGIKFNDDIEERELEQILADDIEINIEINEQTKYKQEKQSNKKVIRRVNFEKVNKDKKRLGDIGEDIIYQYECNRLRESGNQKLAEKVELVSRTQGDGLGYDIVSYNPDGQEIFIEVKTTKKNISDDFYISQNEIEASRQYGDRYKLYRLYALKLITGTANLKVYEGPIDENNSNIELQPVNYKVKLI